VDCLQVDLEILDLPLVLDAVLFVFDFDIGDLRLDRVLFLHVGDDRIEILLKVLHLLVDIFGQLVLFGIGVAEHQLLYVQIDAFGLFDYVLRISLNLLNLCKDAAYFALLLF